MHRGVCIVVIETNIHYPNKLLGSTKFVFDPLV